MQISTAETLALRALAYIAADGEAFDRFLALSGLDIDDLRRRAGEPELLAAVMDFLRSDDALAQGFASAEGIDGEALRAARGQLPGGHD